MIVIWPWQERKKKEKQDRMQERTDIELRNSIFDIAWWTESALIFYTDFKQSHWEDCFAT